MAKQKELHEITREIEDGEGVSAADAKRLLEYFQKTLKRIKDVLEDFDYQAGTEG